MKTPAHWTWRDGEVEPGPCVLFDLDGVLANGDHRQHLLNPKQGRRKDWKTFFSKAGEDLLIEEVAVDRCGFETRNPRVERSALRLETLQFGIQRSDLGFEASVRPQTPFAVDAVIAEIADQNGDQHP